MRALASATVISAMISLRSGRGRAVIAGFAAGFRKQADALDAHGLILRLEHIVEREAAHRDSRQRLHLDAGLPQRLRQRLDAHASPLRHKPEIHGDLGQRQRMAERDKLVRLLGRHDAGDAGGGEHIAFRRLARFDQRQGSGGHENIALGDSGARRGGLFPHIDHGGLALVVDMAQLAHAEAP